MRQSLEDTLQELHEQLACVDDLDEQQTEMLREALSDIQSRLEGRHGESTNLADRLREATHQFSSSHPTLTQTAGRIADLLSQMGI